MGPRDGAVADGARGAAPQRARRVARPREAPLPCRKPFELVDDRLSSPLRTLDIAGVLRRSDADAAQRFGRDGGEGVVEPPPRAVREPGGEHAKAGPEDFRPRLHLRDHPGYFVIRDAPAQRPGRRRRRRVSDEERRGGSAERGGELERRAELVRHQVRRRDVRDAVRVARHLREKADGERDEHRREAIRIVNPAWDGRRKARAEHRGADDRDGYIPTLLRDHALCDRHCERADVREWADVRVHRAVVARCCCGGGCVAKWPPRRKKGLPSPRLTPASTASKAPR